jgi:hypothetical protein
MKSLTKTSYTFASDEEPSEKDLSALMHEVAVEAKQRAQQAEQNLLEEIRRAISAALQQEENKK